MKHVTGRVITLEEPAQESVFFLSDEISLQEGERQSWETICRVVTLYDGDLDITRAKLQEAVGNFAAGTYGQAIFVNVAHDDRGGSAGEITDLRLEGDKLRGQIEWSEFGVDAVRRRGFRYFSAEFPWRLDYRDPETNERHGNVLLGAALTIRPRVKRLDPINPERVRLWFDGDRHYAVNPTLRIQLAEEVEVIMKDFLKKLREALKAKKLAEPVIEPLAEAFEKAAVHLGEDREALQGLLDEFTAAGVKLAESLGDQVVTLDIKIPEAKPAGGNGDVVPLSEEDVKRILAEANKQQDDDKRKLQEKLDGNVTLFSETVEASESFKGLSPETRNRLLSAKDLITGDMTEQQVKALAEHTVKNATEIAVAAELTARGFTVPHGSVQIVRDGSDNSIKALQEEIDKRLGLADLSPAKRYARTDGVLFQENKAFAERVLEHFDRDPRRRVQLEEEAKSIKLAGGDGLVSDVSVPVVWERTVIREALYQMVGLQFVEVGTEAFASSYSIPYSYRDTSAGGIDNTRKYEGQAIERAGVIQTAETAYHTPQKLSFEVSDELRYLTAARHLQWDAVTENQRNASRIIGEDADRLILNEILRAADEYAAVAVSNENLELQADDTDRVFVLANFPVVRPRNVYDAQGSQVGSTLNPVTVTYDSVARAEYDGSGEQEAGIYYVLNYNLGEIYLVDEAGAIQTPADATAYTISYSYAANRYNFDTDLGSATAEDHWDTFLYRYALRKTEIEDNRYHMANYGLMRGTPFTQISQAKQFAANFRRPGTDLSADGSLGRIRDVPNFKAFGPNLHIGDQRVVVGERGITRFRMVKPWMMGELENQTDSNGRFTGKKEAYGDQFIVLHTPTQLKRAATSINLYSATARAARVNP